MSQRKPQPRTGDARHIAICPRDVSPIDPVTAADRHYVATQQLLKLQVLRSLGIPAHVLKPPAD